MPRALTDQISTRKMQPIDHLEMGETRDSFERFAPDFEGGLNPEEPLIFGRPIALNVRFWEDSALTPICRVSKTWTQISRAAGSMRRKGKFSRSRNVEPARAGPAR